LLLGKLEHFENTEDFGDQLTKFACSTVQTMKSNAEKYSLTQLKMKMGIAVGNIVAGWCKLF
jgi:hypothetical protein